MHFHISIRQPKKKAQYVLKEAKEKLKEEKKCKYDRGMVKKSYLCNHFFIIDTI